MRPFALPRPPSAALPLVEALRPAVLLLVTVLASWTVTAPALAQATVAGTLFSDPTRPQGTSSDGRVLIYAPDPLERGSSISHWDLSASPDLLMEPANSPLLDFAQLDLTTPALRDLGWQSGNSTITLQIDDPATTGFNDPELGDQRRRAMQFVADTWAGLLGSGVEIHMSVSFQPLPCGDGSGVLAQAGTEFIFEDFANAPVANTWYPGALAESLSGENLSLEDVANPDAADIRAEFNSRIDEGCLAEGTRYYYGLDGDVPQGQVSFVNVALHEVAHGLGFISFTDSASGTFFRGLPGIYERQLFDEEFGGTWPQLSRVERVASAVNGGNLVWNGPRVNQAAGNFLADGLLLEVTEPAPLAGFFRLSPAVFGPPVTRQGLAGELAIARDGSADPTLACGSLVNPAEVRGKIAVVDRGTCLFVEKALNVQAAGALAMLVVNNVPGPPITLGGDEPGIQIPSVHISQADGRRIQDALTVGVPPSPPSGLTATPLAGGRALLEWQDNSVDETGFRLERRLEGGSFQRVTTVGENVTRFEDSGLEIGRTYAYRVRAQNAAGASAFSNLASLTVPELPPTAPSDLVARTLSDTEIDLAWRDRSADEDFFLLERRPVLRQGEDGRLELLEGPFTEVAEIPADETSFVLTGLDPATTYNFRLRAVNDNGSSEPTAESPGSTAAVSDTTDGPAPCVAGETTLCLQDGRFQVQVGLRNQRQDGAPALGQAVAGTRETGFFWFFRPDNLELVVKLLDATSFADAYWFFYGGLSDVEYWIVVTDTDTGRVRSYYNPPEEICGQADTAAFLEEDFEQPEAGASFAGPAAGPTSLRGGSVVAAPTSTFGPTGELSPGAGTLLPLSAAGDAGASGTCEPEAGVLCLLEGRFAVTVEWRDLRSGDSGVGNAVPDERSDASGFFWFFGPQNIELVTKVIDGTSVNGNFWFFYGALSDVEYQITVEDTVTSNTAVFTNPMGNVCGDGRTDAFPAATE